MKRKFMGIILIFLGVVAVAIGILIVCSKPKTEEIQIDLASGSQKGKSTLHDKSDAGLNEAKAKGNDFEGYVANIFKDRSVFSVKNWYQGVTSSDGVYAESNLNPDFEIEQKFTENFKVKYWIECKYRSSFKDGKINIDANQLKRYKEKQGETRQKVLLAIGIGGDPSNPSDFYLVPLDSVWNHDITADYLSSFKLAEPSENFKSHIETYFREVVFPASKDRKH